MLKKRLNNLIQNIFCTSLKLQLLYQCALEPDGAFADINLKTQNRLFVEPSTRLYRGSPRGADINSHGVVLVGVGVHRSALQPISLFTIVRLACSGSFVDCRMWKRNFGNTTINLHPLQLQNYTRKYSLYLFINNSYTRL